MSKKRLRAKKYLTLVSMSDLLVTSFMTEVSCVSLTDCHLESLFGTEDWGTGYKNAPILQYQSFIDIFKVFFVSVIYNWHNSLRCLASVRSVVLGIALYRRFHTSGFADVLVKSTGL